MSKYPKELKDKIIRLHLEEGRTRKSLTKEFHLGTGTLTYWLKELRNFVSIVKKEKYNKV